MITLKESILSKTKDKVNSVGNDLERFYNIPSINDFYVSPWNRNHIQIDWNCQELLDIYRSKYPNVLYREGSGLIFQIDQTWKGAQVLNVFVFKPNKNNWCLRGWNHVFTGGNLRIYKKEVIKLIEKLAHDPEKMDAFLKQSEEQFRNSNYTEKDLLKDL